MGNFENVGVFGAIAIVGIGVFMLIKLVEGVKFPEFPTLPTIELPDGPYTNRGPAGFDSMGNPTKDAQVGKGDGGGGGDAF